MKKKRSCLTKDIIGFIGTCLCAYKKINLVSIPDGRFSKDTEAQGLSIILGGL